jgi:two-component system, OmpR family, sensor histidine kinase RstB
MATLVAILGLISHYIFTLSNQVRSEHYWFDLFQPAIVHVAHLNQATLDVLQQRNLIVSTQLQDVDLNSLEFKRLTHDQLVISSGNGLIWGFKKIGDDSVLALSTEASGRAAYELYAHLIIAALGTNPQPEARAQIIEHLDDVFDVQIQHEESTEQLLTPSGLQALADNGLYLDLRPDQSIAWIQAQDGSILQVQLPEPFSALSLPLGFLLFVFIVVALSVVLFFVLQIFERRLRNIETVASRIARGELDARVKYDAEGDAIGRLGKAFNSMADHIQRLMFVQKEMIHAVSHELRTPVARIRFGVQMIEDCRDDKMMKNQIAGIDGDIQELDELIDEILTYARLEQGGPILTFQEDNVRAIVEQVVAEQSSTKPSMKIFAEYKHGSDKWKMAEVESRYIHRSIQNLVGNATRYAKSTVKIACTFDQDTCRVDVEDDGPGIPESEWERVFTPFARLDDSRTRSSGGYGLGLSIVRRILYWHGGQAFLGRSEMGGAKFSLVWPRKQDRH